MSDSQDDSVRSTEEDDQRTEDDESGKLYAEARPDVAVAEASTGAPSEETEEEETEEEESEEEENE